MYSPEEKLQSHLQGLACTSQVCKKLHFRRVLSSLNQSPFFVFLLLSYALPRSYHDEVAGWCQWPSDTDSERRQALWISAKLDEDGRWIHYQHKLPVETPPRIPMIALRSGFPVDQTGGCSNKARAECVFTIQELGVSTLLVRPRSLLKKQRSYEERIADGKFRRVAPNNIYGLRSCEVLPAWLLTIQIIPPQPGNRSYT